MSEIKQHSIQTFEKMYFKMTIIPLSIIDQSELFQHQTFIV